MKANDVFKVLKWVQSNRQWMLGDAKPIMQSIRAKAEYDMNFKCSVSVIRDCMIESGVPVRRSKEAARIQGLEERCEMYRTLFLKVAAFTNVPQEIAADLRESMDLDAEVMRALRIDRREEIVG